MSTPDQIQALVNELQTALGVRIVAGTIVLNLNQGKLASFKTETYQRIEVLTISRDRV
jgi:hypothetical protein